MAIKFKTPRQQDEEEIRRAAKPTPEEARQAGQEDDTDIYGAAKDTSVFGEAAEGMEMGQPIPGEVAQAVQDASDAAKAGDTYVQDLFPEPSTEPDQGDGGGAAEQPDEPQGLFEDLGDIDTRQERERQAFADELEARRAEAMQQAQARAGLGGMGLSGATAELTADIGRQEARAGDIAMADLGRRQQQETFDELRRQASIWGFEEEFGIDVDGDGVEGSPSGEGKDDDLFGGRQGTKTEEQARESLAESGIDPTTLEEGSALDAMAFNNTLVETYTDESGQIIKVYRRPDNTYFKQTTSQ
jgi:hypothetical protein